MKKSYYLLFTSLFILISSAIYSQEYNNLIEEYLNENAPNLELQTEDVSDWIVTNEVYSEKSEVTHIYIQQTHKGVPIFNAVANFSVKNNKIFFTRNSFISNVATKINSINPLLTSATAIEKAASELNLSGTSSITLLETLETNKFIYSKSGVSQEEIPVSLVYQPMPDNTLKLAWNLSIYQHDGKHWWNVRLDANTGEIINKNDYSVSCDFSKEDSFETSDIHTASFKNLQITNYESSSLLSGEQYNVFPIPTESPNDGTRSTLTEPQDATASPYGWHDTDEADGAEYTFTRGNNVIVQEDGNGNNSGGYSPDGTSSLVFDFPLDLNQKSIGYQDASLTNLFYLNNIMHDIYYQYGFDVPSGNFQENIYGARLGDPNDPVIADGQDGSGTNNANFATPPDGASPRMQMFIWDAPELLHINSGTLIGDYVANDSNFNDGATTPGPSGVDLLTSPAVTADLVIVDDGTAAPTEACDPIINGAELIGKIAVIRRGNCNFTDKVQNAQDNGAVGVIIVNNVASPEVIMGGETTTVNIPAISISQALGESIITAIEDGETINTTLSNFGIDASLDNVIIAHEYGHGISNRLVGGRDNTSCLNNAEQGGEGWSDFFGLMITMKPSDTEDDARGVATFSNGEAIDGFGIRQFRYTPDMSVNPMTFGDVQNQTSVHGVGTIWATMLWDLNWRMIGAYGYDSDIYTGTGGNNMTLSLVIEALKLSPCNPGFEDNRDAILAADDALYGGANKCLIWEVFARRGLGYTASSGDANSIVDQVEAFDMPPEDELGGASCSLSVDDEKLGLISIYPNPSDGNITIKGFNKLGNAMVTIFDLNGRKVFARELNLDADSRINASQLNTGFYILKIQKDDFVHSEKLIIE